MSSAKYWVDEVLENVKKDILPYGHDFNKVLNRQIRLGRVKENSLPERHAGAQRYVLTTAGEQHLKKLQSQK